MAISIFLNGETARYLSAFSIAAIVVKADRILVFHRPADLPHTVEAIWWLRAADAERVAQRARAIVSKLISASAAAPAAARDLAVGLTSHNDLLVRAKASVQRLASQTEQARLSGHLRDFNREYKTRRLKAQNEGRTFPSYTVALRRLRGALAQQAAARSGAAAKIETASLIAQVLEIA
jgi:hypothetical protein